MSDRADQVMGGELPVKFVGGPLDGDERVVRDGDKRVVHELPDSICVPIPVAPGLAAEPVDPVRPIDIPAHRYRLQRNRGRLFYRYEGQVR